MRKLLLQLLALLGGVGLVAILLLLPALKRPYVDAFYTRFTTPPAASLVIGTSRAAMAVQPNVLQAQLGTRYAGPWLNYSFTLSLSPFGPTYLASIQRKLAPGTRHGLFVVAVDPWSVSMETQRPEQPPFFPEDNQLLGLMKSVSQEPNLEYLLHERQPLYQVALHDTSSLVKLRRDGWVEVVLPRNPAFKKEHEASRLGVYNELATTLHLSKARLASLRQTINFLKEHGTVVVVRLPTGEAMTALEHKYQPDFDQFMQRTSTELGVPYLSYIDLVYPTTDGNHLWRGAAQPFSQRLATDIARLPAQH
jgi:hypothetical protein